MNTSTNTNPTCIPLSEVANPEDLWNLVLEGETIPEDEKPEVI